jgi:hypothetical protein
MTDLKAPQEPVEVRRQILEARTRLGPSADIDWDSMAVWLGNRVPSYLWKHWKGELEERGFTWQRFLKVMKYRTDDALLWAEGRTPWEAFVGKVVESLEGPLGEMARRR